MQLLLPNRRPAVKIYEVMIIFVEERGNSETNADQSAAFDYVVGENAGCDVLGVCVASTESRVARCALNGKTIISAVLKPGDSCYYADDCFAGPTGRTGGLLRHQLSGSKDENSRNPDISSSNSEGTVKYLKTLDATGKECKHNNPRVEVCVLKSSNARNRYKKEKEKEFIHRVDLCFFTSRRSNRTAMQNRFYEAKRTTTFADLKTKEGFESEKLNMRGLKEHEGDIRISRKKTRRVKSLGYFNVASPFQVEYLGYFAETEKSLNKFIVAKFLELLISQKQPQSDHLNQIDAPPLHRSFRAPLSHCQSVNFSIRWRDSDLDNCIFSITLYDFSEETAKALCINFCNCVKDRNKGNSSFEQNVTVKTQISFLLCERSEDIDNVECELWLREDDE
ncbi:hypothetical protein WN51_02124 [Melipona quadrifasciata]|uniref:Uncharacterized protein n=1 Tax=Melipona quadrifasciata TaxID=166423 RepID=A0A0M8ZTB2_9HYME|nr:hypothetical protein WN51_02124 [Melipona quadrifasciata]